MKTNAIGSFLFIALDGNPLAIGEEVLLKSRPGVAGVAIWRTGERGRRFTLRSVVDGLSYTHAQNLYLLYRELIGQDPIDVVRADKALTSDQTKIAVLDVKPVDGRIMPQLGGVGGLNPPHKGWCECDWELIFVDLPS